MLNQYNSDNKYKLNIITETKKNSLSKNIVEYLNLSKDDLIENFTDRNFI